MFVIDSAVNGQPMKGTDHRGNVTKFVPPRQDPGLTVLYVLKFLIPMRRALR